MKQTNLTAPSYDEASSSGEEDDDGSSSGSSSSSSRSNHEDKEAGNSVVVTEHTRHARRRQDPLKGEFNSDNEEEEDGSSSSSAEEYQGEPPRLSVDSSGHDNNNNNDDEEEEDNQEEDSSTPAEHDETDLTLQERLDQNEARGLRTLRQQRERKRTALEIASERLAQFKHKSKTKRGHTTTTGWDNDNDDDDNDGDGDNNNKDATTNQIKRKKSKHAPTEVSSKRSDFFRRGPLRLNESGLGIEIGANRYKPLDPRTNSLNGHLNEEGFEKSYEFLQDMRDKEIIQLKRKIGARKETGKKGKRKRRQLNISGGSMEEDESRLLQLKQEKADFERRKVDRAAKRTVKNTIKTEVEEGKRGVYFLKRKEKKKLEFEAKIDELRKRGGHKAAEKALEKRRKKAKSRDSSMFAK